MIMADTGLGVVVLISFIFFFVTPNALLTLKLEEESDTCDRVLMADDELVDEMVLSSRGLPRIFAVACRKTSLMSSSVCILLATVPTSLNCHFESASELLLSAFDEDSSDNCVVSGTVFLDATSLLKAPRRCEPSLFAFAVRSKLIVRRCQCCLEETFYTTYLAH
jgi:hypothetical protein